MLECQEGGFFGDADNYAKFNTDGTLTLYGPGRVTRHIRVGAGSWKPGVAAPTAGFSGVYPHLSFAANADEEAHYQILVPFRRAAGTAIEVEVDWYYTGVQDNGTVSWDIEYLSCAAGENPTANGANVTKVTAGTHTVDTLIRTSFAAGAIASGLINDGEPLGMRFWRHGDTNEFDTLGKAAILIAVHLHFTLDKLGKDI